MGPRGGVLVGIAAVLVIVCFFLPWVGEGGDNFSGWQVAKEAEGFRVLFLVPLAAIACLAITVRMYMGGMDLRTGAGVMLALAGFGLGIVVTILGSLWDAVGESFFKYLKFGGWGIFLASIALIVGASLDLGSRESEYTPPPPAA